ncbi:hypothetical protein DL771_010557 [Monosporascus sp. 5C6A]|nr:hypothetical protein DL771_010557 [Monosporascus sp. 5C6A]
MSHNGSMSSSQAAPEIEMEANRYRPQHYHSLARIMAREANQAIFRRFQELNYLRIMALQAELMELKTVFDDRCKTDQTDNPSFSKSFRDLYLSRIATPPRLCGCKPEGPSTLLSTDQDLWQNTQYELLCRIDAKMSEYMANIRKPEKSQLKALQNWLYREDGGDGFLDGSENLVWDEDDTHHYVCLATGGETDIFTALIRKLISAVFPWLFRKKKGKQVVDERSGMWLFDEDKLNTASNIVALVLSSTLPVLTIFVLDSRDSTTERLGFTVLFTALFALVLGVLSSAKRAEIFAATATFAAVEVVFIGSALGSENNSSSSTSGN